MPIALAMPVSPTMDVDVQLGFALHAKPPTHASLLHWHVPDGYRPAVHAVGHRKPEV